jgi:dipeptidyl aminopeptidase/acylaminoacyl peptidase
MLIAHGANDPRVKQAESDQIVKVMKDKGLYVEYMVFPDEGHGFAKPENRLKFYAAAEKFLAQCLGGRYEE